MAWLERNGAGARRVCQTVPTRETGGSARAAGAGMCFAVLLTAVQGDQDSLTQPMIPRSQRAFVDDDNALRPHRAVRRGCEQTFWSEDFLR